MPNNSPCGSASHVENIGIWKAGSPTSNPLLLKAQSRQSFIGLQQPHRTTERTITGRVCCRSQGPQASGKEWRFWLQKRHGFLRQTCPTNLFWAVRRILRTWAAERLAATLPSHCYLNLNLDKCSLVCSSHIAQLRAQSLHCNKSIQILETTTPWPNPLLLCMRLAFFCSWNERMGMMQA